MSRRPSPAGEPELPIYRTAVPDGWEVLEPPSFRATGGSLDAYSTWLRGELARRSGPFTLGGHSFGAALAVARRRAR